MSLIIRYYSGLGIDAAGRTLAQTQSLDGTKMEYYHDFIQWMFPLREPSRYNPTAPTLNDADVRAFLDRPDLRDNLRRSFAAFLHFLGLEYADGAVREAGPVRPRVFSTPNHNWLRITRVLICLRTLGLEDECRAFFAYLEGVYESGAGVNESTFGYWRDAARGAGG